MVEEATENGIARKNTAWAHGLVHSPRHFKHTVAVARINNQVKDLGVRQAHTLCLKLLNDLQELICSEELLFLVLLPQSAAPHVDPAQMNESAFISLVRRDVWVFESDNLVLNSLLQSIIACVNIRTTLFLKVALLFKLVHQWRIQGRNDVVLERIDSLVA